ncbi:hypothetical protein H311_01628, partial [Anncaliia algerae PRA109]
MCVIPQNGLVKYKIVRSAFNFDIFIDFIESLTNYFIQNP